MVAWVLRVYKVKERLSPVDFSHGNLVIVTLAPRVQSLKNITKYVSYNFLLVEGYLFIFIEDTVNKYCVL